MIVESSVMIGDIKMVTGRIKRGQVNFRCVYVYKCEELIFEHYYHVTHQVNGDYRVSVPFRRNNNNNRR